MTDRVFVDTNVFVYHFDVTQQKKHEIASDWISRLWESRQGRLSVQVLQELYVTLTAKLDPGLDRPSAQNIVRSLFAWQPVPPDESILSMAWNIEDRWQFAFWDALMVATAKSAGCTLLLTEDLQHDQLVEGIRVVSPFKVEPGAVL